MADTKTSRFLSSDDRLAVGASDPAILDRICNHLQACFRASAWMISTFDYEGSSGNVVRANGVGPDFVKSYQDLRVAEDPWVPPDGGFGLNAWPGEAVTDRTALEAAPFFRHWLAPQGLAAAMRGMIESNRTQQAYITLFRVAGEPCFTAADAARLDELLSIVREVVGVHYRSRLIELERNAALNALDRLSMGVILVDRRGSIVATNRSATEILKGADGLLARRGELVTELAKETEALRQSIRAVAGAAAERGTEGVLSITRRSGLRPLSLVVAPLGSLGVHLAGAAPMAVVFVSDAERQVPTGEARCTRLYGLTNVEARLAGLLIVGKSLEEAAAELRVSIHTARGYLKQIFTKTGVNRQSGLIRLFMSGPGQLRDDHQPGVPPLRQRA